MRLFPWRMEWRPNAATAVFVGLLAALAFLNLHHVSEFLYFKYGAGGRREPAVTAGSLAAARVRALIVQAQVPIALAQGPVAAVAARWRRSWLWLWFAP
jgi:hypothetical protein